LEGVDERMTRTHNDLDRIVAALGAAGEVYRSRSLDSIAARQKKNGDIVTDAELEANQKLFEMLVEKGDGWLSEETADDGSRFRCSRIWFVDPLDGTKEFVRQIPEWCVSIALMEDGEFVAAGVKNPQTDELIYGSREIGVVWRSGQAKSAEAKIVPREPLVLASRSEVERGEWERFGRGLFQIRPMGSVAYKLALVAGGKADATWTLVPKSEWDVAAGVALLQFARGYVLTIEGSPPAFNRKSLRLPGLVGFSRAGLERLRPFLHVILKDPEFRDCVPWARTLATPDSETTQPGMPRDESGIVS
jgi:myo-inositol-1(or 4)-monophosphatase